MSQTAAKLDVSTVNLSPDFSTTDAKFGTDDRGSLSPDELAQLLDNFSRIDQVDNHTHEPRVKVSCPEGEFSIRMSTGKLYLYHARDMTQPPAELDVPGLMALFTGSEAAENATAGLDSDLPKPDSKWKVLLGAGLLVVGLGLNVWALNSFFQPDPVWPPPTDAEVVTDPGTLTLYATQLPGTYATGSGAGQRAIVILPDNHITFQLIGEGGPAAVSRESHDTYALGKKGDGMHLITQRFGSVEVQSDGSLFLSGDLYERRESGK